MAWNTVARWLEVAADACRRFNNGKIAGFIVEELQADEIRSFAGSKNVAAANATGFYLTLGLLTFNSWNQFWNRP